MYTDKTIILTKRDDLGKLSMKYKKKSDDRRYSFSAQALVLHLRFSSTAVDEKSAQGLPPKIYRRTL